MISPLKNLQHKNKKVGKHWNINHPVKGSPNEFLFLFLFSSVSFKCQIQENKIFFS